MKNIKSLLTITVLTAGFGFGVVEGWAKDRVLTAAKSTPGSYCHLHFPAIDERTLSWEQPALKDDSSGDIIHFYGSCDYDPHGKDAVQTQKRQYQRNLYRGND